MSILRHYTNIGVRSMVRSKVCVHTARGLCLFGKIDIDKRMRNSKRRRRFSTQRLLNFVVKIHTHVDYNVMFQSKVYFAYNSLFRIFQSIFCFRKCLHFVGRIQLRHLFTYCMACLDLLVIGDRSQM